MHQIEYSGFPALLDDLDALQEEIHAALKRIWLVLGGVILPCAGLLLFALGSAK